MLLGSACVSKEVDSCSGPGMGPDVDGPASTVVMPSTVDVLFCCLVEDEKELFLRIA
jgi:hypothetical protein